MARPKPDEKRFSRTIKCDNCGRRAVQHRPNGRFCSAKCRVENFWKRKLGVAKPVEVEKDAFGVDSLPRPGQR